MLPETRAFVIRGDDGEEYGPVGLEELRQWTRENRAGLGTTVRLDEPGSLWQPWQYYPELVALLAEAQVAGPVSGQSGVTVAPMGRRMLAMVVDVMLSSILTSPILYVVMSLNVPDWENQFTLILLQPQNPIPEPLREYVLLGNMISYVVLALYMAGFHAAHGQTPAKAILRLRVVDQNGQKPAFLKSFLRGLLFVISFYLMGIPMAYAFFNPQRRALHDIVADTYVTEA